jgi:hypothetical protein
VASLFEEEINLIFRKSFPTKGISDHTSKYEFEEQLD